MSRSSFKIADGIAPEKLAGLQPETTVGIDVGHIHAIPKVSEAPGEDWPDAKMINELGGMGVARLFEVG